MADSAKIDKFWNFFVYNKSEFENSTEHDAAEKLNFLLENLNEVETNLAIELSREVNGVRELIISPEGNKEKFEIVQRIIDHAPKINGWSFVAFRQPVEYDFTLNHEDLKFTPSEMFFEPLIEGDKLDLIIYINNIKSYDFDTVAFFGLITMDNFLGEYDCVMKVRHYDFVDLEEATNKSKLKPFSELRLFVKEFHDKKLN